MTSNDLIGAVFDGFAFDYDMRVLVEAFTTARVVVSAVSTNDTGRFRFRIGWVWLKDIIEDIGTGKFPTYMMQGEWPFRHNGSHWDAYGINAVFDFKLTVSLSRAKRGQTPLVWPEYEEIMKNKHWKGI